MEKLKPTEEVLTFVNDLITMASNVNSSTRKNMQELEGVEKDNTEFGKISQSMELDSCKADEKQIKNLLGLIAKLSREYSMDQTLLKKIEEIESECRSTLTEFPDFLQRKKKEWGI